MDVALYERFEEVIHNPSSINSLLEKIQPASSDQGKSRTYVIDRLVKAAMSTDIRIKLNACVILQMLLKVH